jgi:hypothetical protein
VFCFEDSPDVVSITNTFELLRNTLHIPETWPFVQTAATFKSTTVAKFQSESAVSVRESKRAFNDPEVACSIAYIRSNFGWLPEVIKRSET